jgi:signal peptidase
MTPTIPLGAVAVEQPIAISAIRPGDVVTLTTANGAVFTHRVTRVATIDNRVYVETKGDANAIVDGALQPATEVSGIVRFNVPFAGFALAFLGIPSGILSVVSMLGSLLASVWLLEEMEADRRTAHETPGLLGNGVPA